MAIKLPRPRRQAVILAAALLEAADSQASLWHTADPRHRAGILDRLANAYQTIAATCDPAPIPPTPGSWRAKAAYTELATLAALLAHSEQRLATGGPGALPLTWHHLPHHLHDLGAAAQQAWKQFLLTTSRHERSHLLRTTLTATAAEPRAAAFLTAAGWTELTIADRPLPAPLPAAGPSHPAEGHD
jgi:hypothetical protein